MELIATREQLNWSPLTDPTAWTTPTHSRLRLAMLRYPALSLIAAQPIVDLSNYPDSRIASKTRACSTTQVLFSKSSCDSPPPVRSGSVTRTSFFLSPKSSHHIALWRLVSRLDLGQFELRREAYLVGSKSLGLSRLAYHCLPLPPVQSISPQSPVDLRPSFVASLSVGHRIAPTHSTDYHADPPVYTKFYLNRTT